MRPKRDEQQGVAVELRDYVRVLRARKWLILVSVIVVTLGAIGLSLRQEPTYSAVAEIVVAQQNTGLTTLGVAQPDASYQPGRDEVQTQVEVIHSRRIASLVLEELNSNTTIDSLLQRVTVSADTGTNVVSIAAIDSSAARAATIANLFAEKYIAWSRDNQRASIQAAAADVEQRLAQAKMQISQLDDTASGSNAATADRVESEAARSLYVTLADRLEELRIAEQLTTGKGSILATAVPDPSPSAPDHRRDATLGLALGLLVGLGIAFGVEQLDTRIKSADDAGAVSGLPVVARIPLEKGVGKEKRKHLTLLDRPDSPAAEAYRMLRNNLDYLNIDKDIKAVLVTSAAPREGKSTVAANLAVVLSQAGHKVMLVACDFHVAGMEQFLQLSPTAGLSDVLAGTWNVSQVAQKPEGYDHLWVLAAGPLPPNPTELLRSAAMGRLMADLRGLVDWVILDSAPVLATAEAAAVVRWVDGVLLVTRAGVSERDALRASCEQLRSVGARILGLAVVAAEEYAGADGYYGYGSH
jgi:capsular exopolysaccharide synthesis family protein